LRFGGLLGIGRLGARIKAADKPADAGGELCGKLGDGVKKAA
jgi:hypothetical protein